MKERLIIFTRYPEPGKTKTRLIPALGAEGAAVLQRQMTEHTLFQAKKLQDSVSVEVRYTGSDRDRMQDWLGADLLYQLQGTGDLGDRMCQAFQDAFDAGMEQVVIVGIDCPDLDATQISKAIAALYDNDLVLGPATDGGYYLIGLSRLIPQLFVGITWGTAEVLQQTLEVARSLVLSLILLTPLDDVDRPEDLFIWEKLNSSFPGSSNFSFQQERPRTDQISVIIPVLNEANTIQNVLIELQQSAHIEIIVVDGGSQDDTVELVKSLGIRVISSPLGRASQMNAGAIAARGEILLFLHADTRLPHEFDQFVRQTLAQPGAIAGAFELQIDASIRGLRLIERTVNWRSRFLQMPYGDQAIFLSAKVFREIGGFPELPIMEDFELIRRLRKMGKIAIAPAAVLTSGRRWQKLGILRTTLINQIIVVAYFLGVSPNRIACWYRQGS